jgi:DNA-binding transcriptional ArsR family regulator
MSLMRSGDRFSGQGNRSDNLTALPVKAMEKIGLFKKTGNLVLYKKSERICAATFVVSDSIASESLRERVREEALSIFSGVRDAIARRGAVLPADADRLALGALSLASVLELACRIGEITESNYNLMRQECVRLAEALVETASRVSDVLDPRVLDAGLKDETPVQVPAPRTAPAPRATIYKGQVKDTKENAPALEVSFKGSARDFVAGISASIEDRENKIIESVKGLGKVSIKDILDAVPDIGEKTLQRALISLVSRGVLKKEGERRWSRYSLAQESLAV